MKFLINMNLPRDLRRQLGALGHQCRHVGDIGMAESLDVAIMSEAKAQQEVIITRDLDHGHLLAFSGESAPSVIILRLCNLHPDTLIAQFPRVWREIEVPLTEGAIVVLDDAALRIRNLPITREPSH